MKKLLSLALCVILLSSLCGCSLVADTSELLKTPRLTGEMYSVEKALKKSIAEGYTLEYPSVGDKRSAIVLEDLDGNGKKEAIAFYSKTDKEEKQMHLSLLTDGSKDYRLAFDFSIIAAGIEKIEFCDFNSDGKKEVVAGFDIYGNNEKQLVVFKYQSGKLSELMRTEYTNFVCNDLIGNGKRQLLIQKLNEKESANEAVLYSLNGKTFSKASTCSLDRNVSSVSKIVCAPLSNGKPAVYIDEIKGVGAITEVLTVIDGKLSNPPIALNSESAKSIRSAGIPFFDINNDGYLEIPIPTASTESVENGENLVYWCTFDGKKPLVKESAFVNVVDGYSIFVPAVFSGKLKITKNPEKRIRRVYYKSDATEKEMFTVRVVSKNDDPAEYSGEVLAEKNGELYIMEIKNSVTELNLNKDELKKMFRFNEF